MKAKTLRSSIVWTSLVVLAVGCSKPGPQRLVVTGNVTYQGTPIEDGLIRFVPLEAGAGPMAGDVITKGQYQVTAKGGVPLGKCRVEIKARKAVAQPQRAGGLDLAVLPDPAVQLIPPKYNAESELVATIEPDDDGDEIVRDFHLP